MTKGFITLAVLATMALGMTASAQAGGATSAPSKYSNGQHYAAVNQNNGGYAITEFSSSSAHTSAPKR